MIHNVAGLKWNVARIPYNVASNDENIAHFLLGHLLQIISSDTFTVARRAALASVIRPTRIQHELAHARCGNAKSRGNLTSKFF